MTRDNVPAIPFQTFFVSKELSNCPLTTDIIKFGKKVDEFGILKDGECNISLTFGKRLLINAKKENIENLKNQDIIEIVDYDPIKNIIIVIGKKFPTIETPVHWTIQKARHDVNATLQITSKNLYDHLINDLPTTEKKTPKGTIEQAKEILKTLRIGKNILMKNEGVLLVGFNLKEIEDSLSVIIEDFK